MSIKAPGNGGAVLVGQLAKLLSIELQGPADVVGPGQISIGGTTAATATNGTGQIVPNRCMGYLVINVAGTTFKVPYYHA